MARVAPDSTEAREIDLALSKWRQGDVTLDEKWFVHVGDGAVALTDSAEQSAGEGPQALTSEVMGLVVVTQTCDVVRSCVDRPYVEVAPLVSVTSDKLQEISRGRRPSYAFLPNLESQLLVADLDRTMSVEKSLVAKWQRTPGYDSESDGRAFAQALARKRLRFAFPDDFGEFVQKLRKRLSDKHDKSSLEGESLRALREIRVLASPSWQEAKISLFFWFVRSADGQVAAISNWDNHLRKWLDLLPTNDRYSEVEGEVVELADMTAEDYVNSDPLDLDHLSGQSP